MKNKQGFISLLSDYGFKVAFADESNTLFLRKALQALLQNNTPIKRVQFSRNELTATTSKARGGLLDLICIDEQKRTFIVEMQLGYYKEFIQRTKFYAFHKFNTLVERGNYKFEQLTPIYCIGLLAKGIFPNSKEYYHFGRLKNQKGEEMDKQITYIIIEIDKFKKKEAEIQSDLDKLIYIMKQSGKIKGLDELPKILTEDWIEQALSKVDKSQLSPEQRFQFEMMLARNGSLIEMRQQEDKLLVEKVQKQESINTAKKMKQEDIDCAIISKITGLSIEEIEQL